MQVRTWKVQFFFCFYVWVRGNSQQNQLEKWLPGNNYTCATILKNVPILLVIRLMRIQKRIWCPFKCIDNNAFNDISPLFVKNFRTVYLKNNFISDFCVEGPPHPINKQIWHLHHNKSALPKNWNGHWSKVATWCLFHCAYVFVIHQQQNVNHVPTSWNIFQRRLLHMTLLWDSK